MSVATGTVTFPITIDLGGGRGDISHSAFAPNPANPSGNDLSYLNNQIGFPVPPTDTSTPTTPADTSTVNPPYWCILAPWASACQRASQQAASNATARNQAAQAAISPAQQNYQSLLIIAVVVIIAVMLIRAVT